MKKIYKYYRERLVEISGRSRSLYSKKINKKSAFDIGRLLDGDYNAIDDFTDFLFSKKRSTFGLIDKYSTERICKNLKTQEQVEKQFRDKRPMKKPESQIETVRRVRLQRDEEKQAIIDQVDDLRVLKREIEEFSHETGRYEMFIGYPFVEGAIGREMIIRAPLLLFPAVIHIENETTAVLELKPNEPVQLNKVLLLAYAQRYRLDTDDLVMEFDSLSDAKLKNIDAVISYLRGFGFKLSYNKRKGMFNFSSAKEPHPGDPLEVKHYSVIGRFPLANAIYNDYKALENRKNTDAIRELLESRDPKKIKKPNTNLYAINSLDFAQEEAIEKLNQNGNMVIYGPPGTGKSQTIVNIITDALCKNKRVLVVSQKKAALDVVYNRLGSLNGRAMYINDPEKNKAEFFARTKNTHLSIVNDKAAPKTEAYDAKYKQIKSAIDGEVNMLQSISDILFTPTAFGLPLATMYAECNTFGKTAFERYIYKQMLGNPKIMSFKYNDLKNLIRVIKEKRKAELYYKKQELQDQNPLADHVKSELNVNTINSVKSLINKVLNKRRPIPFNINKYPNARVLLAFYLENNLTNKRDQEQVIQFIAKLEKKTQKEVADNFAEAMRAIKNYVNEYNLLETVLDRKGFAMTLEGILNGNTTVLRLLRNALDNYVYVRSVNLNISELTENELAILKFCHKSTKNFKEFTESVDSIIPARMYHELVGAEDRHKQRLSKIMDYENIRNRIIALKEEQKEVVRNICLDMFKIGYANMYNSTPNNKNFFYQINKQQNLWTIRRIMEVFGDLMLTLFPCWLLSPESVSTIMPLKENLFDLVLFDEASQVFIENTLPTIYRSRHIAVAGDNKQLRPTALFMRRYMGSDTDDLDLNTQAALEVESLLDLATSRYSSINLNYHYRSKHEEFISFSNYAFYDCKLQIAPNLSKNIHSKPIERIKVNGQWIDRKNRVEAAEVLKLLKKILKNRKEKETIGIITFNSEQENLIEDLIDKECARDEKFRAVIAKERNRKEHGENISMFVKNLENVQGDERDIIIFCIGYAKNEYGKVVSHFGPLNTEGGENRLNVAVTRAKKKIYIVTSIEPEELSVDGTKNAGPKFFKKYLQYVRAVANGSTKEVAQILESFRPRNDSASAAPTGIAAQVKTELEKMGYTVEADLGNNSYKMSLAIYDKKLDRYLVGIEFDEAAYRSSSSVIERDVFRRTFMEGRGWTILRIWSRDWWLNRTKVLTRIDKAATKVRNSFKTSTK